MKEAELLEMLRAGRTQESSWSERKPESVNKRELRREACAFANSLPDGEEAVIFIGLNDKTGAVSGIANMDSLQKKIDDALLKDCYPAISYRTRELSHEGQAVLVLIIPASAKKPHFTGPAFVRNGSKTAVASEEQFNELILSQTDKARQLLKFKANHTIFAVLGVNYRLGSLRPFQGGGYLEGGDDCKVDACNGHTVRFHRLKDGYFFEEALDRVSIEYDASKGKPVIHVTAPGR